MAQISIDLANAILSGDGVTRHELEQFCIFFINATYQIEQLEQELAEAKAALAAQAQQPTELSDKCKVAASCLTYNDTEKEAVAKHLLLEASQELRRAQAQHNQWISVEERLPEKFVDVLVHPRPTDYICEAAWLGDAWYWSDYELNFGVITNKCVVTHWMPLPPAPEGE